MTWAKSSWRVWLPGLVLFGLACLPYLQTGSFGFVGLDDPEYVERNPFVLSGLSWRSIYGVWGNVGYAANWHPLTWISLMTDVTLFGVNPGMMHLHSMVLHGLNTLLLYALLVLLGHRATQNQDTEYSAKMSAAQPSWETLLLAFVSAGLWAVHPLRVEAVAWISERKEVLCVFFGLLSYLMYFKSLSTQRGRCFLGASFGFAFLAISAKPVAVSLPVIIAVYDVFHFRRIRVFPQLLWFGLALAGCTLTLAAQRDAVAPLEMLGLAGRVRNALAAIATYLWQVADVRHLAVFYPYRDVQPWYKMVAGITVLFGFGAAGIIFLCRAWYTALSKSALNVLFGMLWCSIGLVPMLGIVQVGSQAHADRYTYWIGGGFAVIMLGLFQKILRGRKAVYVGIGCLGSVLMLLLSGFTWRQAQTWRDTRTLYEHADAVIPNNGWASCSLAEYYAGCQELEKAEACYRKSIACRENDTNLSGLATLKALQGGVAMDEAFELASRALQLNPESPDAHEVMGLIALRSQAWAPAEEHLKKSLTRRCKNPVVLEWLAMAQHNQKKYADACATYEQALILMPENTKMRKNYEMTRKLLEREGK